LPPQAVIRAAATTSIPKSTKTFFSDIANSPYDWFCTGELFCYEPKAPPYQY
jgi:hypothetical protein